MPIQDFIIRLLISMLLGFIIGMERQYRHTLAGIRTNVLVCMGACLFVMFPSLIGSTDSPRIAGQVVTGIGFLGGGVILKEGFNVRGLNTAATLWCTASVGVLSSTGYWIYGVIAALLIVFSNIVLRLFARKLFKFNKNSENDDGEHEYVISIKCLDDVEFNVRSTLMNMVSKESILLRKLESIEMEAPGKVRVKAELIGIENSDMVIERFVSTLSLEMGVTSVGWKVIN